MIMRCVISEQISKHCDEPEEIECEYCHSSMTDNDGYIECDNEECGHVIYAPDEDCFIDEDY